MDPLSIAASVAGLLTLTAQVISLCDGLYHNMKKRPKGFKDLLEDLNSLVAVLEELKTCPSQQPADEEAALKLCLQGCNNAIKDVRTELNDLKGLFKSNIIVKAYAQLTFKNKMTTIMESRERVDRFTSAVSVALAVRQRQSTQTVHAKLDKLAIEVSRTQRASAQPARWLDPLQQYVDVSAAKLKETTASSAPSLATKSSTTLIDDGTSGPGSLRASSTSNSNNIASFGTFDDWLESFAANNDDSKPKPVEAVALASAPTEEPAPEANVLAISQQDKVDFVVTGLSAVSDGQTESKTESFKMKLSDYLDDVLKVLKERGYCDICGFRLGASLLTPLASHTDEVRVTVTMGPSTFSLAKGLQISIDESLEYYFDSFVRAGETGPDGLPLSLFKMSDDGKICIVDYFGAESKRLEISFCRTLRVPEDGTIYNPPVLMSPFPITSADELTSNRLPHLRRKGGLLIPLWQREALAITFSGEPPEDRYVKENPAADFAVKIYGGSINVISGASHKPAVGDAQDYIITPMQNRLDGFLVRKGIVKQFVAMPLGAGHTAEGQLTTQEMLGGLQVLVAPRFRARAVFRDHRDQSMSPRDLGLKSGDSIYMKGDAVTSRARQFRHGTTNLYFAGDHRVFHLTEDARPRFVHEVLFGSFGATRLNKPVELQAVRPWKLNILARQPKEYVKTDYRPGRWLALRETRCQSADLPTAFSPFMGINDLSRLLARSLGVSDTVLFDQNDLELPRSKIYVPIHQLTSEGASLFCQSYMLVPLSGAGPERKPQISMPPKKELQWDMGLAPGGEIRQAIVPDKQPMEWNWARAKLFNVQILNSVVFESVTGIVPPPPPISFKDYVRAKLPFFHLISDEALAGGQIISRLQTVGTRETKKAVQLKNKLMSGNEVIGCVICSEYLADTILKPCTHVFCGRCARDGMQDSGQIRCAACRKLAKEIVSFSAPMELPQRSGDNTDVQTGAGPVPTAVPSTTAISSQKDDADGAASKLDREEGLDGPVHITPVTHPQTLVLGGTKAAIAEIENLIGAGKGHDETVAWTNGRTAMQIAASTGDVAILSKLLDAGISANEPPGGVNGRTALQAAAERGDRDIVVRFLSAGADPNAPASLSGGLTAIEAAAKSGNTTILKVLLEHGATVQSYLTRKSALHLAAERGFDSVVSLLLCSGCDPDAYVDLSEDTPNKGRRWHLDYSKRFVTAATLAAERGHLRVLKALRNGGANAIPLKAACEYGQIRVVYWLLEVLEEYEAQGSAQKKGETEEQDQDEEEDADDEEDYTYKWYAEDPPKITDDHGYPLRKGFEGELDRLVDTAAIHGQAEVLKLLVERGALLRIPGRMESVPKPKNPYDADDGAAPRYFGSTPLHDAANSGSVDTVAYLLSKGFELEENRVSAAKTPLMVAAQGGKFLVFKYLIERGANIHAKDSEGGTVIIKAASSGNEDILRLLFTKDIDLLQTARYSESPLSAALYHGHISAAKLILDPMGKRKDQPAYGPILAHALRVAAASGQFFMVTEVLNHGADPNLGPKNHPGGALQHMGTSFDDETSEDNLLACARVLLDRGGSISALDDVLDVTVQRGKLRLATWFAENSGALETVTVSEMGWSRRIKDAVKNQQVGYAKALIGGYRRHSASQPQSDGFLPNDFSLSAAFSAAAELGQIEIVDLLLAASSDADAARYVDEVAYQLGPRDHLRRYLEERYMVTAGASTKRGAVVRSIYERFRLRLIQSASFGASTFLS